MYYALGNMWEVLGSLLNIYMYAWSIIWLYYITLDRLLIGSRCLVYRSCRSSDLTTPFLNLLAIREALGSSGIRTASVVPTHLPSSPTRVSWLSQMLSSTNTLVCIHDNSILCSLWHPAMYLCIVYNVLVCFRVLFLTYWYTCLSWFTVPYQ